MFGMAFNGVVGWLLATLGVAVVAVLLSGWVARRLPWRRGRWLCAAIGLLALALTLPTSGGQDDSLPPQGTVESVVGSFRWAGTEAGNPSSWPVQVATAVALAVGTAPVLLPVVRLRERSRAAREEHEARHADGGRGA